MLARLAAMGILLLAHGAARADSVKPFDPRQCFCWGSIVRDMSLGHFTFDEATQVLGYVVDVPLTVGPGDVMREPGDVIHTNMWGVSDGPQLLFNMSLSDTSPYWCTRPLPSSDADEIRLTSTACQRTETVGGVIPDSCVEDFALADIVAFVDEVNRTDDCDGSVTRILGVSGPTEPGCHGGAAHPAWVVAAIMRLVRARSKSYAARGARQEQ